MADISQPDILERHHLTDVTALVRPDTEDNWKKKWVGIFLEGSHRGKVLPSGRNILDQWFEKSESTDPEFQLLMNSFFLERYGVGSLEELMIFYQAEDKNFSSFQRKCDRIGKLVDEREKRVINLWVENLKGFRQNELSEEGTTTQNFLKKRFLEWLNQTEPSRKEGWVSPEKILEKIAPYLQDEKRLRQDEERLNEAERKKRGEVILRCRLGKIEDAGEKRRMANWVEAWQGKRGEVRKMVFLYNPHDIDRIDRVVLEVGEDEQRRFFAVKFGTFCAAFNRDGFKPAGLVLEPEINGEKLWRFWRATPFVVLEEGKRLDNQPAIKVKTAYAPLSRPSPRR